MPEAIPQFPRGSAGCSPATRERCRTALRRLAPSFNPVPREYFATPRSLARAVCFLALWNTARAFALAIRARTRVALGPQVCIEAEAAHRRCQTSWRDLNSGEKGAATPE